MLQRIVNGILQGPARRARDRTLRNAAALRNAGELRAAVTALEGLLAMRAQDAEARLLLADVRRELGELAAAARLVKDVLSRERHRSDAWLTLAAVMRDAGNLRHAAKAYMRAIALSPEDLRPRLELAVLLIGLDQAKDAASLLRYVLNRAPDSAEAHGNLGVALQRLGDGETALAHFARAVALDESNVLLRNNLALALREAGRLDDAEREIRSALSRDPAAPTTLNNLAVILADRGALEEARALVVPLVERSPGFTEARCTLARVLQDAGDIAGAEIHLERALEQRPGDPNVRQLRGFLRLATGDFGRGWDDYAARFETAETPRRGFPFPEWRGEPLTGKPVLVYAEQGIGDEIMFANCFADVIAEAGRVVIECDARLAALFARSFPHAAVFAGRLHGSHPWVAEAGVIDVQIAAGSLPGRYRRDVASFPRHAGYLRPDPAKVARYRERLSGLGAGRTVGIAWRGGLAKTRRTQRSIEPAALRPILAREGVAFVSVQHAASEVDLAALGELAPGRFHHWHDALGDADETAALVSALDVTITVCSWIVHLGGALGADMRVMVPANPEWRYLREGSTMPWYPTARLVRQRVSGDWREVVCAVAAEL